MQKCYENEVEIEVRDSGLKNKYYVKITNQMGMLYIYVIALMLFNLDCGYCNADAY